MACYLQVAMKIDSHIATCTFFMKISNSSLRVFALISLDSGIRVCLNYN